jgi:tol-pal system protein YbgF
MMKKMWSNIGTVIFVFSLFACAAPPAREDGNIMLLEKQIAEANQKIEEIYHRVSVIQFMADNHERALRELKKTVEKQKKEEKEMGAVTSEAMPEKGIDPVAKPSPAVSAETAENLYNQARALFKDQAYDQASLLFDALSEKYPGHDLADNAFYWSGECHYARKNFSQAILAFKKVIKNYPDGGKAPDALLKIGYAYLSLDDPANASLYLKQVIKNYPFTAAAAKAEQRLKTIQTR